MSASQPYCDFQRLRNSDLWFKFMTTCKHSLLLIFAPIYSAYCSGMCGIEVFFGTFVKPKQGGVVRTLSLPATVHGHNFRRQIYTEFRLRTTSGGICNLTILIHCFRCACMSELKTSQNKQFNEHNKHLIARVLHYLIHSVSVPQGKGEGSPNVLK